MDIYAVSDTVLEDIIHTLDMHDLLMDEVSEEVYDALKEHIVACLTRQGYIPADAGERS